MEIFDLPDDIISLPDGNISLPEHGCHGRTGTSAWFFPFTTDYLPVRTRTTMKIATKTPRHKVKKIKFFGAPLCLCAFVAYIFNALQKSQRSKSVIISISAGSTVLTNLQISTFN